MAEFGDELTAGLVARLAAGLATGLADGFWRSRMPLATQGDAIATISPTTPKTQLDLIINAPPSKRVGCSMGSGPGRVQTRGLAWRDRVAQDRPLRLKGWQSAGAPRSRLASTHALVFCTPSLTVAGTTMGPRTSTLIFSREPGNVSLR